MIDKIKKLFRYSKLSSSKGAFLSDKSYKYDTLYFVSKFIISHLNDKKFFNKKGNRQDCVKFIEKTFSLKENSSVSINYLHEILNLLVFSNLIEKIDQEIYEIKNLKILKWIIQKMENSYIFLFLLTYHTLYNEGIINVYYQYLESSKLSQKKFYLDRLFELITTKSNRVSNPNSVWGKLTVKYPLMVLGLFYKERCVSKGLKITDNYISAESLSMNVNGTKTLSGTIKKNDYIFRFNMDYVFKSLKKYNKKRLTI